MVGNHDKYERQNLEQPASEVDPFTIERYSQFFGRMPKDAQKVLDIGCNTGRGGQHLKTLAPSLTMIGLDCVQDRLDALPDCYEQRVYGLSNEIPLEDGHTDVIVAGEFLEHLYPSDVDKTLCEFQRVLSIGGRLLMTTPNPNYIKNRLERRSVFGTSHLTQHYPKVLRWRLMMHGFSNVKILGSGKVSRYLGSYFPWLSVYGSYLVIADKK